jgi:hypothetical protein
MLKITKLTVNIFENNLLIRTKDFFRFEYPDAVVVDRDGKDFRFTSMINAVLSKPHIIIYDIATIDSKIIRDSLIKTLPGNTYCLIKMSKGIQEELVDYMKNSLKQVLLVDSKKYKYVIIKKLSELLSRGIKTEYNEITIVERRSVTVEQIDNIED